MPKRVPTTGGSAQVAPASTMVANTPKGSGGRDGAGRTRAIKRGAAVASGPAVDGASGLVDKSLVPGGFRIGYRYVDADSPSAVVISRFDFSEERVVFTAPAGANYTAADWSPTRDRILLGYCVGKTCAIRIVTPNGQAGPVLDNGTDPAWSPDGKSISEAKPESSDQNALFVIPASGGSIIRIGEWAGSCCSGAKWSPDSSRLAYVDPSRHVLRVARRDGTSSRSFSDPKDLFQNVSGTTLTWSPDGQRLMIERLVRNENDPPSTAHRLLAVLDVSTGGWRELGEWDGLDWAPDGRSLLVQRPKSSTTADGSCGTPREIGVLSIDDDVLLRTFGEGCSATVSPDRKMVAVGDLARARVVTLDANNDKGTVVYESDGGYRSRSPQLLCCTWTPGSDALVLTDADAVVARVDGRARWQRR